MIIGISGKIRAGKDTLGELIQYLTTTKKEYKTQYTPESWLERPLAHHHSPWTVKRYGDKLKDVVSVITGIPRRDLEKQAVKEQSLGENWTVWRVYVVDLLGKRFKLFRTEEEADRYVEQLSSHLEYLPENKFWKEKEVLTVRRLLQLTGTEAGRQIIHPDIWVNALFADYRILSTADGDKQYNKTGPVFPDWIITDVRLPNEAQAVRHRGGILVRVDRSPEHRFPDLWHRFKTHRNYKSWDEFLKAHSLLETVHHISETALDDWADWDFKLYNNGSIDKLAQKAKEITEAIHAK